MADPIKHVVLLMLENASCDRYLGYLSDKGGPYPFPQFNGIDPSTKRFNVDWRNRKFEQVPTKLKQMQLDPMHEPFNAAAQIKNECSGYVRDLEEAFPDEKPELIEECLANVMAYYPRGFLPAHHALAEDFRPCDNWHCSVPGPTWPNRFFALSGGSNGLVHMPASGWTAEPLTKAKMMYSQLQPTIFTRLLEKGNTFKIFYHDFPCSLIMLQNLFTRKVLRNYSRFDEFLKLAAGDEKDFPEFTFIEPKYFGGEQNDDHPPHNSLKAQALVAQVYNALRKNPALWESCLFVITHDENGGFYDHVCPPLGAVSPVKAIEGWSESDFAQYGPRVPTIIVSPFAKRGPETTLFDHTSLLKYMKDKWKLGDLGARVDAANSVAKALDFNSPPRKDCIEKIRDITPEELKSEHPELETGVENPHHDAIKLFKMLLMHDGAVALIGEITAKQGSLNSLPEIVAFLKRAPLKIAVALCVEILKNWTAITQAQKDRLDETRDAKVESIIEAAKKEEVPTSSSN